MSHIVSHVATHLSLVRPVVGPDAAPARETPAATAGGARAGSRIRIVDGALSCIAAQGIGKTTLDDVARAAGCSRATVYRVFPGGKDSVFAAAVDTELARFYSALAVRLGDAETLEDVLVDGIATGAAMFAANAALRYLLEHEPGVVLPYLAFASMDRLLAGAATLFAPFLGRFLDHDEAERVAEFGTRIALSYLSCPAPGTDITDREDVRRLVRRFVLPGVASATGEPVSGDDNRAMPPSRAGTRRKGEKG
jgi:AcrR family transcriptional regulator